MVEARSKLVTKLTWKHWWLLFRFTSAQNHFMWKSRLSSDYGQFVLARHFWIESKNLYSADANTRAKIATPSDKEPPKKSIRFELLSTIVNEKLEKHYLHFLLATIGGPDKWRSFFVIFFQSLWTDRFDLFSEG